MIYLVEYHDEHYGYAAHKFESLDEAQEYAKGTFAKMRGTIVNAWDGERGFKYSKATGMSGVTIYQACTNPGCTEFLPLGGIMRIERDEETGSLVETVYDTCGYCD